MKTDRILQQALRLAKQLAKRLRLGAPAAAPQGKKLPHLKHRREWTED